jgi:hypothetical protein
MHPESVTAQKTKGVQMTSSDNKSPNSQSTLGISLRSIRRLSEYRFAQLLEIAFRAIKTKGAFAKLQRVRRQQEISCLRQSIMAKNDSLSTVPVSTYTYEMVHVHAFNATNRMRQMASLNNATKGSLDHSYYATKPYME